MFIWSLQFLMESETVMSASILSGSWLSFPIFIILCTGEWLAQTYFLLLLWDVSNILESHFAAQFIWWLVLLLKDIPLFAILWPTGKIFLEEKRNYPACHNKSFDLCQMQLSKENGAQIYSDMIVGSSMEKSTDLFPTFFRALSLLFL